MGAPTTTTGTPSGLAVRRAAGAAFRGLVSARRFLEGVLGADKYERYLAHHEALHPGVEPMTVREFWRDYTDWQEKNPQGRCC